MPNNFLKKYVPVSNIIINDGKGVMVGNYTHYKKQREKETSTFPDSGLLVAGIFKEDESLQNEFYLNLKSDFDFERYSAGNINEFHFHVSGTGEIIRVMDVSESYDKKRGSVLEIFEYNLDFFRKYN